MRLTGCLAFLFCLLNATDRIGAATSDVIELTEDNFSEKLAEGEWMVEIYAPWCSHCQQLEPTWRRLANELKGKVLVGKINGDQQPSLMQRFAIQGYPHICHMRQGQTRDYVGDRSLEDLKHFAEKGWRHVRPQPFYRAPNSPVGLMLGKLLTLPHKAMQLHRHLRDVKKVPDLVLLLGFLAIPVTIGMCSICMLDAWYSRQPSAWVPPPAQPHAHAH